MQECCLVVVEDRVVYWLSVVLALPYEPLIAQNISNKVSGNRGIRAPSLWLSVLLRLALRLQPRALRRGVISPITLHSERAD